MISFLRKSLLISCLFSVISCGKNSGTDKNYSQNLSLGSLASFEQIEAKESFLGSCGAKTSQKQYQELLSLSDIKTFNNYKEAEYRSYRIAELFAEAKDRRGIFASMYVEITKESVGSSARGEYQNSQKATELVKRFADRYFEPLHAYLLSGAKIPQSSTKIDSKWQEYYRLAEDCNASDLRILGTGVNNHMTYDLPLSVYEIGASPNFKDDFMKFGSILIQKKRQSTNLLISQQNTYAAEFFDLFVFGKAVDVLFPKGTAATWGFQLIRAEAWFNGMNLYQNFAFTNGSIHAAWTARQALLATMPKSNSNMKGTEE
jgi:Family of unknown function (DUF5995)